MLVDLEIIFNNTYGYIQFTYEVPDKYNKNIRIGDIVEIPFRNKLRLGIVLNLESNNSYVDNIKPIKKIVAHLNNYQIRYLEQIAISNNINIGMLLYKYIDYKQLIKQKVIDKSSSSINKNSDLYLKIKNSNNIIFVSSLKEAKEVAKYLSSMGKVINFYQKTGGVNEFTNFWKNLKQFENIILLSVNFEKILIKKSYKVHFYNCNNYSFSLPTLNNINIVESSIIKHKIFKGNFYYYSEFPSLEFFNKVKNYFLEIPDVEFTYVYGNNLQECMELFDKMFNDHEMKIYTSNSNIDTISNKHKITNDITVTNLDAVILFNPTISHNGVLSSNRLINFIKTVTFFVKRNAEIIIFSTKKINLNKQLTDAKINTWAEKEKTERAKYGPNINLKIFKVISDKELDITRYRNYMVGPKLLGDLFVYELKIQINKKYNYNEIMSIFSILKNSELDRVRSL